MTPEAKQYIESEDFIAGFDCLKHEVPWIVPEAIFQLEELLTKDDIILEVGAGGSTVFYAKHCGYVTSIETDYDWGAKVLKYLYKNSIVNAFVSVIPDQNQILSELKNAYHEDVSVFSVDTQGGDYNRSEILNAFLSKGVSSRLRMIILDNYGHQGLFPLHYDSLLNLGEGWKVFTFGHPRWAGNGTRIYLKIK